MLARKTSVFRDERGNSLIEYALLLSLVAVICLVGIRALGASAKTQFLHAGTSMSAAASSPSDDGSNDDGRGSRHPHS